MSFNVTACVDPGVNETYGILTTQNKVFNLVACWQEVSHDCKNWTGVYCTALSTYSILSLVNLALLGYVMHYYRKS